MYILMAKKMVDSWEVGSDPQILCGLIIVSDTLQVIGTCFKV